MVEIIAQGDYGPNTQVRITEWIENVPVKDIDGRVIGRAKIGDNGVIQAVIDDTTMSKELFDILRTGMGSGLSIEAVTQPATPSTKYSDEVRARLAQPNPFNQEGAH